MRTELPIRSRPSEAVDQGVEHHLAELERQLNVLRGQVRQAQQLSGLGAAAATMAHEINNLLTPILSYTEQALLPQNERLREKALTVTLKHATVLVKMAERILHLGAAKPVEQAAVPVRRTVDEAIESLCRGLEKDSIVLACDVDEDMTVWCDPLQLHQILFNIFLNARDAMAPVHGGRLSVTGRREGSAVSLQISDTGGGIDPQLLPHIFEPFRSSTGADANGRARCRGLGLALSRDLVQENGGTINVASEPGAGTTFTITLPAFEPQRLEKAVLHTHRNTSD